MDDEEDILALASLCLRRVGRWEVSVARSGREAVDVAASARPDATCANVGETGAKNSTYQCQPKGLRAYQSLGPTARSLANTPKGKSSMKLRDSLSELGTVPHTLPAAGRPTQANAKLSARSSCSPTATTWVPAPARTTTDRERQP